MAGNQCICQPSAAQNAEVQLIFFTLSAAVEALAAFCFGRPGFLGVWSSPVGFNLEMSAAEMQYTKSEQARVYLFYSRIFSQFDNARLRKQKAIRRVVNSHTRQVTTLPTDRLVGILQYLLQNEIFQYESNARRVFPGLFAQSITEDDKKIKVQTTTDMAPCDDLKLSLLDDIGR